MRETERMIRNRGSLVRGDTLKGKKIRQAQGKVCKNNKKNPRQEKN